MMSNVWSVVTIPALSAIWLTAFYGLSAIRPPTIKAAVTWPGMVNVLLGIAFLAMTAGSFMMLLACVMGANIYTWRGSLLMWGVAMVFVVAGKFSPWRRFIRRTVDMQKLEKKWEGHAQPTLDDLSNLIAESRKALALPVKDRANECARVLPEVVIALEKIAAKQYRMARLRSDLQVAVDDLRMKALRKESDIEPIVIRVNSILDKIEETINDE